MLYVLETRTISIRQSFMFGERAGHRIGLALSIQQGKYCVTKCTVFTFLMMFTIKKYKFIFYQYI